jgi:hypothetical protein
LANEVYFFFAVSIKIVSATNNSSKINGPPLNHNQGIASNFLTLGSFKK